MFFPSNLEVYLDIKDASNPSIIDQNGYELWWCSCLIGRAVNGYFFIVFVFISSIASPIFNISRNYVKDTQELIKLYVLILNKRI